MIPLKRLVLEAYPDFPNHRQLPEISIQGLECDSRKVEKGFLFVAIRGVKKDGGEFIREAIERGAAAVVTDSREDGAQEIPFILVPECRLAMARLATAFYGNPSKCLKVIGITGTNGKTTASFIIEHLLARQNKKVGVIGTINYRFGGKEIPAVETTPGPLKMQQILSQMVDAGCQFAVMEVSSHALDQNRVGGIDFAGGLFTNLTQDHLDYHKTFEAYFECKSRLFLGLSRDKFSVLNRDDAWSEKLRKKVSSSVITYSVNKKADFEADAIEWTGGVTHFNLMFHAEKIKVRLPLIGVHNVYNALGALAVIHGLGFDVKKACADLNSFKGVPGRLEAVNCGQDFSVFIDFAHTPDGLENVMRSLKPYKSGKLIVVFGCGGDRDKTKRPKMGKIAAEYGDFVYITSDNPRSEDPQTIAEEVRQGLPKDFKDYVVEVDRKKAVRQALLSAREGDLVLLAGKGHERTQVVGDKALPYSDREETERVLYGR